MNFFEHQDQARRKTRMLVVLFTLAVIAIVLVINVLVLVVLGATTGLDRSGRAVQFLLVHNGPLFFWATLITLGVIGVASLYRTMDLRGGGGDVARGLGGTLVEPDTTDPLRRRLRNVVEEIAIASGVPVPEVFVLEREQGINAFAAGYSPADAAVAVTRGTLENLNRDEIQGVIAHEFSHILNGDMRLNIRLIGLLFGILMMSVIGRRVMLSLRYSRSRDAGAIMIIALVVMLLGYIGLFFGRWIKAAVSRQREYLADASAVQFTRNPDGVAGALKKIGASYAGSFMVSDTEEIGHMLFARGMGRQMFATHPPLEKRIRAIDPSFHPGEFKEIAERMQRHAEAKKAALEVEPEAEERPAGPGGLTLDPGKLIERIGQPGLGQVLIAGALLASIPKPLERAAHAQEWTLEVLFYLLISGDPEVRENQLLMIAEAQGSESESQVRALLAACPQLADEQRLPALEMALPGLRQRPPEELEALQELLDKLIHADGRVTVFEYVLGRLTMLHTAETLHPQRVRSAGHKKLSDCREQVVDLLSIVARHGSEAAGPATAALHAALNVLDKTPPDTPPAFDHWPERLDAALLKLDKLKMQEKQRLVEAMVRCIMHDGRVDTGEFELMRVICASLHVPLPVFEQDTFPAATQ